MGTNEEVSLVSVCGGLHSLSLGYCCVYLFGSTTGINMEFVYRTIVGMVLVGIEVVSLGSSDGVRDSKIWGRKMK